MGGIPVLQLSTVLFENRLFGVLKMAIPVYRSIRYTVGVNKRFRSRLRWTMVERSFDDWIVHWQTAFYIHVVLFLFRYRFVSFRLRWTIVWRLDRSLTNGILHRSVSVRYRFVSVSVSVHFAIRLRWTIARRLDRWLTNGFLHRSVFISFPFRFLSFHYRSVVVPFRSASIARELIITRHRWPLIIRSSMATYIL